MGTSSKYLCASINNKYMLGGLTKTKHCGHLQATIAKMGAADYRLDKADRNSAVLRIEYAKAKSGDRGGGGRGRDRDRGGGGEDRDRGDRDRY